MPVSGVSPITGSGTVASLNPPASGSNGGNGNFAQFLGNALSQANQLSNNADTSAAVYAAGGPVSLSNLMIAEQKASLALDLVVQVRNRVVSAYQSVMNMQV